ncbi:flagellar hook-basal body complex protein FliE [Roseicella aerolata]|uniref:Flagellar hook-basal body complex protein FliE n=1 Tax=Roseicella aerolata TaxID=2883479 RepID=A0A9X1IFT3_9PROT|nr:flagellar hook-basal body complex protein FliE [Roseicella aerolata]MCB4823697.1 flagellar hook-basal body complex protein FliE [Roseicella aerolata]
MPAALGPVQAAAAYRTAQAQPEAAAQGADFGATLRRAVEGVVEIGHSADATSTQALLGQGSVTDVVLAVARAETALQTAVTLRDRVVAAYQDVMRMPI